jgi:hypothetical protein
VYTVVREVWQGWEECGEGSDECKKGVRDECWMWEKVVGNIGGSVYGGIERKLSGRKGNCIFVEGGIIS